MIKLLVLFAWIMVSPWLLGRSVMFHSKKWNGNPIWSYLAGLLMELAWFEIVTVPLCIAKRSLSELIIVWCVPVLVGCAWSLVRHHDFGTEVKWFAGIGCKLWLMSIPFLVIFALQAGFVTQKQHIDDDDANYVARAVVSVETDTLYEYSVYTGKVYKGLPKRYVLAAWPLLPAALSRICGMHPTIIAHMFIPMVLLLWVYLTYARLGAVFYPEEREKQILFILLTALLLTFTGFSIYSSSTFMWIRSWQGKAILAGMGMPLLLALIYPIYRGSEEKTDWWLLFMAVISCCMFSSMGVVLGGVVCVVGGFMTCLARRSWKVLVCSGVCCLPAVLSGIVYLML